MVLKLTNKLLEENNLTNKKVITEYSILKHNFESKLLGIKDVANKEAKILIDDLLEDTNSSVYIKNDINAMPLGINGLVMGKLAKHEKSNVNISITNDITSDILDVVSPRSYNLFCEALGVSLDNALESSKNTKEKLVYLKDEEDKLNSDIKKLKDPEYVARYAREKYMYSKDGELIIRLPDDDNGN